MKEQIQSFIEESIKTKQSLIGDEKILTGIEKAINLISDSLKNQGKVMNWNFTNQIKIPFLITRSPEALAFAKNKSDSDFNKIFSEMKEHIQKLVKLTGEL